MSLLPNALLAQKIVVAYFNHFLIIARLGSYSQFSFTSVPCTFTKKGNFKNLFNIDAAIASGKPQEANKADAFCFFIHER